MFIFNVLIGITNDHLEFCDSLVNAASVYGVVYQSLVFICNGFDDDQLSIWDFLAYLSVCCILFVHDLSPTTQKLLEILIARSINVYCDHARTIRIPELSPERTACRYINQAQQARLTSP